jgi:DNA-binding XRE family transcriptional regulator
MTQEKLADLAEKTPETISNIERGASAPSLQTLELLAKHLNAPVRDLFDFDPSVAKSRRRAELEERLREMVSQLGDESLEAVIGHSALVLQSHKGTVGGRKK